MVLDGVTVQLAPATQQAITVKHTSGTRARVTFWRLEPDGTWAERLQSSAARTGYGGLVAGDLRHQGTGTTPVGTYPLLSSFGTGHRRAGWAMAYRRIRPGDYWVEDNGSAYYNRYRNKKAGGFRYRLPLSNVNGSERLAAYPRQYRLSVVIGYNYTDRVRYRGAGIFLHVNGPGATAGCVSAPLAFLRGVFGRLDPALDPVIAIGR